MVQTSCPSNCPISLLPSLHPKTLVCTSGSVREAYLISLCALPHLFFSGLGPLCETFSFSFKAFFFLFPSLFLWPIATAKMDSLVLNVAVCLSRKKCKQEGSLSFDLGPSLGGRGKNGSLWGFTLMKLSGSRRHQERLPGESQSNGPTKLAVHVQPLALWLLRWMQTDKSETN